MQEIIPTARSCERRVHPRDGRHLEGAKDPSTENDRLVLEGRETIVARFSRHGSAISTGDATDGDAAMPTEEIEQDH